MSLFDRKKKQPEVKKLRADLTYDAPEKAGLYAWYYSPLDARRISSDELAKCISRLCFAPASASTEVKLNYGVSIEAKSAAGWTYSSANRSAEELIQQAVSERHTALAAAFQDFMIPWFTRPVYIGIAANLRTRLFKQHYEMLHAFWQPEHPVSKLLDSEGERPLFEVFELLHNKLGYGHSFALEARVRGFFPDDLFVFVVETDSLGVDEDELCELDTQGSLVDNDAKVRRTVERLFQIISLPVCGRI